MKYQIGLVCFLLVSSLPSLADKVATSNAKSWFNCAFKKLPALWEGTYSKSKMDGAYRSESGDLSVGHIEEIDFVTPVNGYRDFDSREGQIPVPFSKQPEFVKKALKDLTLANAKDHQDCLVKGLRLAREKNDLFLALKLKAINDGLKHKMTQLTPDPDRPLGAVEPSEKKVSPNGRNDSSRLREISPPPEGIEGARHE